MGLLDFFHKIEPDKEKRPFLHTAYDAFFTFAYAPNTTTKGKGVHIRDGMDLKRLMFYVVIALIPCYLFGMINVGHQHFQAMGMYPEFFQAFHLKFFYGLAKVFPMLVVANVVGLGIEFYFAFKNKHAVEEGFLVSGALIPLIMPPDLPLWILAIAVAFAVFIGKEAFGGTGMNLLNIALLTRVFIFFAYPTSISGDSVWIAGFDKLSAGTQVDYGWFVTGVLNPIFEGLGWKTYDTAGVIIDGYTGATPLSIAATAYSKDFANSWDAIKGVYSTQQMWWGGIPGSIGETSKPLIIAGALFLVFTGVASWRIMLGMLIGCCLTGMAFNWFAPEGTNIAVYMNIPWEYHLYMGSFLFAMAFMATDPVTASGTPTGKLIYGFFIGMVGLIIRVLNPAYPEGWMLAILFMNVFAPLIDHFVMQSNMGRRKKRLATIAARQQPGNPAGKSATATTH